MEELEIDLSGRLGATTETSTQQLTLYIPDRDRRGEELGTQRSWVLQAANLLARIGGGVTILPPVEGGWFDPDGPVIVWERPVLVYTFVDPDRLVELLPELRAFLHRMGERTEQGEVIVEFDGSLYRISAFEATP